MDRSPLFEWSAVDGASSYTIQVPRYASFSTRIFAATTDETSFTSSKDLPAARSIGGFVPTTQYLAPAGGPNRAVFQRRLLKYQTPVVFQSEISYNQVNCVP